MALKVLPFPSWIMIDVLNVLTQTNLNHNLIEVNEKSSPLWGMEKGFEIMKSFRKVNWEKCNSEHLFNFFYLLKNEHFFVFKIEF